MTQMQQQERQKLKDSDRGSSGPHTTPSRSISTQTGESTETVLENMGTDSGQNYVSLG